MAILDYTTYNDIRAALGVAEEELPDAILALDIYNVALQADLRAIAPALPSDFIAVKAITSPTPVQQIFLDMTRMVAIYVTAEHLSSSVALFSPKTITDGKTTVDRFASDPWRQVIQRVQMESGKWKGLLTLAYADYQAGAAPQEVTRFFGGGVSPGYDPITG